MTYQRRDDQGRFEQDIDDMKNRSIVAGIIHDELDKFFESSTARLNELDIEDMDQETAEAIADAKKDLKSAIAKRFGNPITSSCISTTRALSSWNGFYKDNWARFAEEWRMAHPGEGKFLPLSAKSRVESRRRECISVCRVEVT
jgi:hypothetical protein